MAYHKLEPFAMHYDAEKKILYLPRGIDLFFIQKALGVPTNELIWLDPTPYDTFDNAMMRFKPRDDRQRQALRFMLGLNEYARNRDYSALLVSSTTGFGKSFCCIYTMCYTKIRSIVITYAITILKQWKDYIMKYTNLKDEDVYLIQGSDSIHMLLNNRTKHINAKIFLVSHSTLRDYGNNYGWDKITELFSIIRVGQMFIDEAHRDFDNICKIACYVNVYKTYYVTATPSRSSKEENKIYQLSIKNFPKLELYDAKIDKHIHYIAIKYASRPTPRQKSEMYNTYGLDKNKYVNYLVGQNNFYKILRIIMDLAIKLNGPCLFYIDTNAAILKVYQWLNENYPEFAGEIGVFSGLVNQEDKVQEKKKRIILSTMKSAGAAEQIDGLKMAVVLAAPFKSTVTAIQAAGRLRDRDTYFVELIDLSFQSIKKYYYYKLSTYNKYMLSVSDVNMKDDDLDTKSYDCMVRREKTMLAIPLRPVDRRFEVVDAISPIKSVPSGKINPIITYTDTE
jgi:superfamily II DNA or RNA helicase